ncbi:MAG: hypothetical protein NE327_18725 [Lentisphaeraceae bacterium]|nr:hypothetical protein [Lentisphaeraceae bacterium]
MNEKEHQEYLKNINLKWRSWWKNQGQKISVLKRKKATPDQASFEEAMKFLKHKAPFKNTNKPIWIPDKWELIFLFSNGDYEARTLETWILQKGAQNSLFKIKGSFINWPSDWDVTTSHYKNIKSNEMDHFLKTLSYLLEYNLQPNLSLKPALNERRLNKYYYPDGQLSLRNKDGLIWNFDGYHFNDDVLQFNFKDNEGYRIDRLGSLTGISYLLLRTIFNNDERWSDTKTLNQSQLDCLTNLLKRSKPTLFTQSSDILHVIGQMGGTKEISAVEDWLKRSKALSAKEIPWQMRSTEFITNSPGNVRNFYTFEVEAATDTLKTIKAKNSK